MVNIIQDSQSFCWKCSVRWNCRKRSNRKRNNGLEIFL